MADTMGALMSFKQNLPLTETPHKKDTGHV